MPRPGELSSQKLKNCFLREFKRATELTESQRAIRTEYFTGYQAHHIVPVEIIRNVINPGDYTYYNQDWNCLMIASYGDAIVHRTSHPRYNDFMALLLTTYRAAYPDASWEDIAYNATEFIRMVLDYAVVEQRRKHEQIDLDQFADIYLWAVYAE